MKLPPETMLETPAIIGLEDLNRQASIIGFLSKFSAQSLGKWKGSLEAQALDGAATSYLVPPPDFYRDSVTAFCVGGFLVFESLKLTEQALKQEECLTLWQQARTTLHSTFNANIGLDEHVPNLEFYNLTHRAQKRHDELAHVLSQLDNFYRESHRDIVGFFAISGAGFVLHQWDTAWNQTCEKHFDELAVDLDPNLFLNISKNE